MGLEFGCCGAVLGPSHTGLGASQDFGWVEADWQFDLQAAFSPVASRKAQSSIANVSLENDS
jgi:hypothetical protein